MIPGAFYSKCIPGALENEMVLTEAMKNNLRQICIYAHTAGIDLEIMRQDLEKKGTLPARDKESSKKALTEIYDYVACSF